MAHPIADAVAAQCAQEPFSGVVRVATGGETWTATASGHADRANARPITLDTRFGIASGTKVFTAAAVARLVDRGRLSFEARLSDLVSTPLPKLDPAITVAQLLTHTAGNPDYFDEETMDDYGALWSDRPSYGMRSPADFVPLFADLEQKFPPGERFAYSNAGYILLGLVIEAVTGQPYADVVRDEVLTPAGMRDSGFFALDALPARCAHGYLDDDGLTTNVYSIPAVGGPDGGMWTTAKDLDLFWRALMDGPLLSPAVRTQVLAAHTPTDEDGQHYGYGVWISGDGDDLTYYVVGEDPGVSMVSSITPHTGVVMTILGNTDSTAWPMHGAVMSALGRLADS